MAALSPHLSFAIANGRPAFLDVRADRYFCLSDDLEAGFIALVERRGDEAYLRSIRAILTARGVLVASQSHGLPAPTRSHRLVDSLTEDGAVTERDCGPWPVVRAVMKAWLHERTLSLERRLARIRARKDAAAGTQHKAGGSLEGLSRAFLHHRAVAPVARVCLIDSLALVELLAAHGHFPEFVMGVTMDPFAAHCWVQSGGTVLNDDLGHAVRFSPILVI